MGGKSLFETRWIFSSLRVYIREHIFSETLKACLAFFGGNVPICAVLLNFLTLPRRCLSPPTALRTAPKSHLASRSLTVSATFTMQQPLLLQRKRAFVLSLTCWWCFCASHYKALWLISLLINLENSTCLQKTKVLRGAHQLGHGK